MMTRCTVRVLAVAWLAELAAAFSSSPRVTVVSSSFGPSELPNSLSREFRRKDKLEQTNGVSTTTLLIGGFVAAVTGLRISSRDRRQRESVVMHGKVSPSAWSYQPVPTPKHGIEGAPPRGPGYRPWIALRQQANRGQRYHRQLKTLKDAKIQKANGGWHKWYPHRAVFNLYQGPESHPDNKWFPAYSPGYDKSEMGPPRNGKPTYSPYLPDFSSDTASKVTIPVGEKGAPTQTEALRSTFVGRQSFASGGSLVACSAPSLNLSARGKTLGARANNRSCRLGVVMHASKKAASSTKNQGRHQNPQHYGVTKKGHAGNAVKAGTMLARQKGSKWHAGANVSVGKNYTLNALKDGIVQWRGNWKDREVYIVPWQYVRERCVWVSPNRLGPKEYKPWMGTIDHDKRHFVLMKRKEWLETDEGKEWADRKAKKKAKQKTIQAKIREIKKAKRGTKESVPAVSE